MRKLPKNPQTKPNKGRVLIIGRRRRVVTEVAPVAPANLAIQETASYLRLFWDDVSDNEQGFRIYRRAFSDPFTVVAELYANQTEFFDGNVEMGVVYTYYVVTFNTAGESEPSDEVQGEIFPTGA